ncbi:MAG: hypothetical protein A2657_01200 [Candidatus Yanofskybacteria bacterium RIFCSPHIGHO2_01_FULL_44_110b]|nr:MAG: hypothetical protein A2657_01200 [Candidatus Yanofskybacteria bacterium RIFCSPHIGHO2_01_FULL_44_110b]OGN18490.1 MAG: hypothetical protein A3F50_01965 [Candidatus Yanofskybacteria bacterium RIFCSPHIGHO2_12_FULL_44_29b]OGN26442.1 MAG: hypothetical protein A3B12_02850 [Candidatus Yanofskybacteria bacterium RIFCSPLOWO2_01_FULL_44_88]
MPLFATTVAISFFGVINMFGIAGWEGPFFEKQLILVLIGIAVMILFSFFNFRYFKNSSILVFALYIFSLLLLAFPSFFQSIRGVNSWIIIGNFTLEPSELMKLAFIIVMAKYFSQRHIHIHQFRHIFVSGIYYAVPAAMIISQPDLGSAIIFTLIWFGMLIASGINKKQLGILAAVGLCILIIGWVFVLKPYQKSRIISFLDPYGDPKGTGYNLIQSKIAIGNGYIWGEGLGRGSQTNLGFLPEPKNDFVFSAVAEQFGLLGITGILAAIAHIISRILNVGLRAGSNFGKLFSIGMAIFIFAHAFVGAGVNVGLLPVTGIPFPFLSYGGSNLISIMIGLGIIQSIKRYS